MVITCPTGPENGFQVQAMDANAQFCQFKSDEIQKFTAGTVERHLLELKQCIKNQPRTIQVPGKLLKSGMRRAMLI